MDNWKVFFIGLPVLSPTWVRKKSLAEEIAGLNVMQFQTILMTVTADDPHNQTFRYEGYDIISLQNLVERDYVIAELQTAQEVIGNYSRRIAEAVKLPSQFAALAPRPREFFGEKAFGRTVDLSDPVVVKAMSTSVAPFMCVNVFSKELNRLDYRRAGASACRAAANTLKLPSVSVVAAGMGEGAYGVQPCTVRQPF